MFGESRRWNRATCSARMGQRFARGCEALELRICLNAAPVAHDDVFRMTQGGSLSITAAPHSTELVGSMSVWRYHDLGTDLGTAWRGSAYDDLNWSQGPGQLGYGEGDESTVLEFGDPNNKHVTYYFRHTFQVSEQHEASALELQILVDDGAVVYLNGSEIQRVNMPLGDIHYDTLAAGFSGFENVYERYALDPGLLVPGENLVAVEVHQYARTSNDVSFDLAMVATYDFITGPLANDEDADGDPLMMHVINLPTHGSLHYDADGSFRYDPDPGFVGSDSFLYFARDGQANSNVALATIVVEPSVPRGHVPVAHDDSYTFGPFESPVSEITLSADDGTSGDFFGDAVVLDGERLFVGARNDSTRVADRTGSVKIFESQGGSWTQVDELFAEDATGHDYFGHAIASDGDRLVVGARIQSNQGFSANGAAYIFERSPSGQWAQAAKLLSPSPHNGEQMGVSVGIAGNWAVVGAWGTGGGQGAAYVYRREVDGWQFHSALAPDAPQQVLMGWSVAIDGQRIAVGAVEDSTRGTWAGAVHVFDFDGNTWRRTAKLFADDAAPRDYFGYAIDLQNDRLLVGANQIYYDESSDGRIDGAAYIFDWDPLASTWHQRAKLVGDGELSTTLHGINRDHFGSSVALDGSRVAVVGKFAADGLKDGVYLFEEQGGDWERVGRLDADYTGITHEDGLAIQGNLVVVGHTEYLSTGTVRVFAVADAEDRPALQVLAAEGVLANDMDVDGDALHTQLASPPKHGALLLAADGALRYTPEFGFEGRDSFEYRVSDDEDGTSTATVEIVVQPVTPPSGVVQGTVWFDRDRDGIRRAAEGEPGLSRWVVFSDINGNGTLEFGEPYARSGADGSYTLTGLQDGPHTIAYLLQSGWEQSPTPSDSLGVAAAVATVPRSMDQSEGNSDNVYPFGLNGGGMRHQQIYAASEFTSAGSVQEIRFRLNDSGLTQPPFNIAPIDMRVTLSYAAHSPRTASRVFADNIGDGAAVVFDGLTSLSGSSHELRPDPFNVRIPVGGDFHYDPALGDLLVDILVRRSPEGVSLDAAHHDAITRVWASDPLAATGATGFGGGSGYGLVTQFTFGQLQSQSVEVTGGVSDSTADFGIGRSRSVPSAPEASGDAYHAATNGILWVGSEGGLLQNDDDGNGDTITSVLRRAATQGFVYLRSDGSFDYIPYPGFIGVDSFSYVAKDSGGLISNETNVVLVVGDVPAAESITVSTTTDELDGDVALGDLSLREAIQIARERPGNNLIRLPAGHYPFSLASVNDDLLGGDLDILADGGHVVIQGAGIDASIIDASQLDRVLELHAGARLELRDLTLRGGHSLSSGGGVEVGAGGLLQLVRVALDSNVAEQGGAINVDDDARLRVIDSVIQSNQATLFSGGGIHASGDTIVVRSTIRDNVALGDGAGIAVMNLVGQAILRESSIYDNHASQRGGAVFVGGAATLSITNSTLSANSATRGGGALYVAGPDADVRVDNSTIYSNSAGSATAALPVGGGIASESPFVLRNSIVAGNQGLGTLPEGVVAARPDDVRGELLEASFNLIGSGLGATGLELGAENLVGTVEAPLDPRLLPLGNYGGPTFSHALQGDSPAVDRGDPVFDVSDGERAGLIDQRNYVRVADSNGVDDDGDLQLEPRLDIGAVEFHVATFVGKVWDDVNADGIFDASKEVGAPDVELILVDVLGRRVESTRSDSAGQYQFNHAVAGSYRVQVILTSSAVVTRYRPHADGDGNDFHPETATTDTLVLAQGEQFVRNAGLYLTTLTAPEPGELRVSEIQAFNAAGDYIELVNLSDRVLDLTGVRFSDGIRFEFRDPSFATMFPGEYRVLAADLRELSSRHPGLAIAGQYDRRLNRDGERIELQTSAGVILEQFDFDGHWFAALDPFNFSLTVRESQLRDGDRGLRSTWQPSSAQGGSPGGADSGLLLVPGSVVINEVMTRPVEGINDWIELHNTSADPIDIGGWYLGNTDAGGDLADDDFEKYRIADGTILPAGGYLRFTREEHFGNPSDAGALRLFGLSSQTPEIVLLTAADVTGRMVGYSESAQFGASASGVSFGRWVVQGNNGSFSQLVALTEPTPNAANSPPRVGPLVVNEILYAPSEPFVTYLEIHNVTDAPVSIPWQLTGDVQFTGPTSDAVIPARGFFVVTDSNAAEAREILNIPSDVAVFGPWSGSLLAGGGDVRLVHREAEQIGPTTIVREIELDRVTYASQSPWPAALQDGVTLERFRPYDFGNDPRNWAASTLPGGSPGYANSMIHLGDLNSDGDVDSGDIDLFFGVLARFATPAPVNVQLGAAFDLNGDRSISREDMDYLIEVLLRSRYGDANLDGSVDGRDFNQWFSHRFRRATWSTGDFNGDSVTDGSDFNLWLKSRFVADAGQSASAARGHTTQRTPRAPLRSSVDGFALAVEAIMSDLTVSGERSPDGLPVTTHVDTAITDDKPHSLIITNAIRVDRTFAALDGMSHQNATVGHRSRWWTTLKQGRMTRN